VFVGVYMPHLSTFEIIDQFLRNSVRTTCHSLSPESHAFCFYSNKHDEIKDSLTYETEVIVVTPNLGFGNDLCNRSSTDLKLLLRRVFYNIQ
jgi:hypothetical protein